MNTTKSMTTRESTKVRRKFKFEKPDAYALLFIIALICAILSYIIPAGEYKRVVKGAVTVAVANSYHHVASSHISVIDFFSAFPLGMADAASIIVLILFAGGALEVLEKTEVINGLIYSIVHRFKNHQFLFILIVAGIFSLLGTTGIISNSVVGFIPLGLLIAKRMKWDAIVGVAIMYLGAYAGFNSSFLSASPLGISQTIAQLPMFSGIGLRTINYLSFVMATVVYIYFYTRRLAKKQQSYLGEEWFPDRSFESNDEMDKVIHFGKRQKLILLVTVAALAVFVFGSLKLGWTDTQMSGIFVLIAVAAGIIYRMQMNEVANTFVIGCRKLVYGAFIAGMARAISEILTQGKLLDTIVHFLATFIQNQSGYVGAFGMYLLSIILHFFISSGSGESVVVVPILTPLADIMHITRQVVVQAVMQGEGVVNCLNPTSGVLMAVLAASGVSYKKWLKFIVPLAGIWFLIGLMTLMIGVFIKWGPY